jgi:hypothetical protein
MKVMETPAMALADKLQRVLDGSIALDDLLDDPANRGECLDACLLGLQHFLSDDDIRAKDADYRDMQETEMRKLIALLRSGADRQTLSKIHFLGRSKV